MKHSIVEYDDPRIIGIEIVSGDVSMLLVNVYLPYDCPDNLDSYMYYLATIDNIVSTYTSPLVYVAGDFNSDIMMVNGQIRQSFGRELVNFCKDESLVIADKDMLDCEQAFTFYSESWKSVHWLDHIVTTQAGAGLIQSICIDHKYIYSDHFPMFICLDLERLSQVLSTDTTSRAARIDWQEVTDEQKSYYMYQSASHLASVALDHDLLMCNDPACKDKHHQADIDKMYNGIIKSLVDAGNETFGNKQVKSHFHPVPGWNDYVKVAHEEAREAFLMWRISKPRQGPVFQLMKSTRARFKYALRFCKSVENRARADSLAKKLLLKDDVIFWKDIKKIGRQGGNVISNTIDNVSGEKDIAQLWQDHYAKLLNSNKDEKHKKSVLDTIKTALPDTCIKFDFNEIGDSIKGLKIGKSPGLDGLQAEHYKYADPALICMLSMVINCMVTHGYITEGAMETVIIPIVKDSKALLTDKNNYRPVAITSVFSKILESVILERYRDTLESRDNQFGFKIGHGTDMCVFTLRQVIEFYHSLSSPVYVCFLDASKAFDRLNHWALFQKLLQRGMPVLIVRLFIFWYSQQKFCIRWGSTYSSQFSTSNGVRQGGIISPVYFNIYMDDLSQVLNRSKIGCTINGMVINHLMYADDSCIMAPSAAGLQKLLSLCCDYAEDNTIIYNKTKTKYMCFKPKLLKNLAVPLVYLNDTPLQLVDQVKYLGVFIDESLTDHNDMIRHKKYLYAKGNLLIRHFKCCSENVKDRLFKAYCSNIYGGHLWTNYAKSSMSNLTTAFNNVYRHLYGIDRGVSMSGIYVEKSIDSFSIILRKAIFNFRQRLLKSCNKYINQMVNSVFFYSHSSYSRVWQDVLYA